MNWFRRKPRTSEQENLSYAYLVGFIDVDEGKFIGCGIFSEQNPTMGPHRFPFTILECGGKDYQEASDKIKLNMDHWQFEWTKKHFHKRIWD